MPNNLFDKVIERRNTCSIKWDRTEQIYKEKELLPMWIADMDFEAPESVVESLKELVNKKMFGYTYVSDEAYNAICNWTRRRYDWKINRELISLTESVVPAISTIIRTFTDSGDKVLIQSPVYGPFYEMIEKNNRIIVNNELILDNNEYKIDFEHFEQCLKDGAKLFILCNPHNPGGRVWHEDELLKMGELCLKYNCLILSDDIHADLIFKPNKYTPIVTLNEQFKNNVITCISPSKTFNLAGLNAAVVIFEDESLKSQFDHTHRQQGFFSIGMFGAAALEAAYRHGEDWLEDLLTYLEENIQITTKFINDNIPKVKVMQPEGTYLLWLNCRNLNLSDAELSSLLITKGKLALEPGKKYGLGGEGFVRMNIACPRKILLEGLERLKIAFG